MGPSAGGPSTSNPLPNKPLRTQKEIGGKRFRVSGYDQYTPIRRRRARRRRIGVAVGTCLVILAVGGWFGYQHLDGSGNKHGVAAVLCGTHGTTAAKHTTAGATTSAVTKAVDPKLLKPADVTVNVYNATDRTGLAAITASTLRSRGFKIGKVTNDPLNETITASAQVRGTAAQLARLQFVRAQVAGATQVLDHRTDATVDLVLGNGYQQLRTPAEAAVVVADDTVTDAKAASKPTCH